MPDAPHALGKGETLEKPGEPALTRPRKELKRKECCPTRHETKKTRTYAWPQSFMHLLEALHASLSLANLPGSCQVKVGSRTMPGSSA